MAAFKARGKEEFGAYWTRILAADTVLTKAIVLDGQVAGNVLSFEREGRREVGYWIGREFWGKGVATEALVAFLEVEKTRPLYAGVAKYNAGSIRVLDK